MNTDYARLTPLSSDAVTRFISVLYVLQSIGAHLLDQVEAALASVDAGILLTINTEPAPVARRCAYGIGLGFAVLVLPFFRELTARGAGLGMLHAQARKLAALGARTLARTLRLLPPLHYTIVHADTVLAWAEFCATGDADVDARDLETCVIQLPIFADADC